MAKAFCKGIGGDCCREVEDRFWVVLFDCQGSWADRSIILNVFLGCDMSVSMLSFDHTEVLGDNLLAVASLPVAGRFADTKSSAKLPNSVPGTLVESRIKPCWAD